jgi:phosphatidylethanolamine-binding protein (PEBP) family uncharacterized protein
MSKARPTQPLNPTRCRTASCLATPLLFCALSLLMAGCGGSSPRQATTPGPLSDQPIDAVASPPAVRPVNAARTRNVPRKNHAQLKPAPAASISVSIAGLGHENEIPKRYTCGGANEPMPIRWRNVPAGTAELAVFVLDLKAKHRKLFFDWAISGISPKAHGTSANAVDQYFVVRNSLGEADYSLCPARGTREVYVVRVLALSAPISTQQDTEASGLYAKAERLATAVGVTGGWYARQ